MCSQRTFACARSVGPLLTPIFVSRLLSSSSCRFLSSCSASCACHFLVFLNSFYSLVSFYSPHLLCRFELLLANRSLHSPHFELLSHLIWVFLAIGHLKFVASGLEPLCAIPRNLCVQCHCASVANVKQTLARPKQLRRAACKSEKIRRRMPRANEQWLCTSFVNPVGKILGKKGYPPDFIRGRMQWV